MTVSTRARYLVDFFVTSRRLARACRLAARRNKTLTRLARMHETCATRVARAAVRKDVKRGGAAVVLSHAEDEQDLSPDADLERVFAGAFHLLITEPTTHPDQVLQWTRRARIWSENRLHVVKVSNVDGSEISLLLGRVCSAMAEDETRGCIMDAYPVGDSLMIRGPKLRMLHVPIEAISSLRDRPQAAQRNFEVDPDGSFLYWPDLDIHLGWDQLVQAVDPEEFRKAQQRSAEFNQRYGAAIRTLREEAGIPQSRIAGLTERQLRRIEHGESRATSKALAALAKAHGLETNVYLDNIATAMQ